MQIKTEKLNRESQKKRLFSYWQKIHNKGADKK